MKSRVFVTVVAIFIGLIVLAGACSAGFVAGRFVDPQAPLAAFSLAQNNTDPLTPPTSDQADTKDVSTPEELQAIFVPFWQAWDLIHDQFVDQPVDDAALMRGAIKGMLDSLGDPHTSYLDPEEYKMLTTQLQGEEEYEGIGAWVDTSSDYLTIISPMPKSPADKAGLRTGDKIIAIDGEDMTGIDGEVVRKQVLGPAGSTVVLTILREGEEPFDVPITAPALTYPALKVGCWKIM